MRFGRRQPRPEPNRCLGAISVRSWPRSALGHLVTVEPTINLLLCAQVDLINVKWGHCKNQKRPITWKGVSMVGELLRQSVGSVAAVFSLWDFRLARSSSLSIGRGSRVAGQIRCARCVAPAFHFFVCAGGAGRARGCVAATGLRRAGGSRLLPTLRTPPDIKAIGASLVMQQ